MTKHPDTIRYKRSRFSAKLPSGHRYTRSHFWLARDPSGDWRVGLTKFATRMLGDLVEYELSVKEGDAIETGQTLGWIEGFKAVSDIYSIASGRYLGANPALERDITLLEADPYGAGWLYAVDAGAQADSIGVEEYMRHLDATIDRMLAGRREGDPNA
jgi:glycine cleavage system H protein